jgi:hypothetical protein
MPAIADRKVLAQMNCITCLDYGECSIGLGLNLEEVLRRSSFQSSATRLLSLISLRRVVGSTERQYKTILAGCYAILQKQSASERKHTPTRCFNYTKSRLQLQGNTTIFCKSLQHATELRPEHPGRNPIVIVPLLYSGIRLQLEVLNQFL